MIDELLKYQEADGRLRAVEREISSTEEHKKYMTALKFLKKAPEKLEALDVKATELRRAFERLEAKYAEIADTISKIGKPDVDLAAYHGDHKLDDEGDDAA